MSGPGRRVDMNRVISVAGTVGFDRVMLITASYALLVEVNELTRISD